MTSVDCCGSFDCLGDAAFFSHDLNFWRFQQEEGADLPGPAAPRPLDLVPLQATVLLLGQVLPKGSPSQKREG